MDIAFRVDANTKIGHGHLSRTLTLADELKRRGLTSVFVVGESSASAVDQIDRRGHRAVVLGGPDEATGEPAEGKWLEVPWSVDADQTIQALDGGEVRAVVVDQYGLEARWERRIRNELNVPVVAVDGIADRPHDCQLLVDPTLSPDRSWEGLVEDHTRCLVGPQYALLRREFARRAPAAVGRDGLVNEVLIAFGGSDAAGATELAVDAVAPLVGDELVATVVAGAGKPGVRTLESRCAGLDGIDFHFDTDEMARLMARADLAVGGAGTMTWERALVGLPAVVIAISDHQVGVARPVAEAGAIRYLGRSGEVGEKRLRRTVRRLAASPDRMRRMSEANRRLMGDDGDVGTAKVAEALTQLLL